MSRLIPAQGCEMCFRRRVGRKLRQTEDTIVRDGTAYFQMISEQSVDELNDIGMNE